MINRFFENFTSKETKAFFGEPINEEVFREIFAKEEKKEENENFDFKDLNFFIGKPDKYDPKKTVNNLVKSLIIRHDEKFKLIFDLVILMGIGVSCLSTMYFFSFGAISGGLTSTYNIILDVFYVISIILNFFTTYIDSMTGKEIFTHKKIALNYLKGWLIFDLISIIPLDYIYSDSTNPNNYNNNRILRFLRLIRLPKLLRLIDAKVIDKLFEDLFVNRQNNSLIIIFNLKYSYKIVRLVIIAVAITFCVACSWWFLIDEYVRKKQENVSSNFVNFTYSNFFGGIEPTTGYEKLAVSAYYSLTTLTTVGYGDFYPQNKDERFLAIFIMLIGVSLFTYVMGNFTDLITTYDKKLGAADNSSNLHNWLALLSNFSKNVPFERDLINKIDLHFNYFWKQDRNAYLTKDDPYLWSLPKSLRIKLVEFMWGDILNNFSHFIMYDKVNKSKYHKFYFEFVFSLLPRRFLQNEIIFNANEEIEETYLILTGEVDIGYSFNKDIQNIKYVVTLGKLEHFGMYYCLNNLKSNYFYKAKSEVTSFAIDKKDLNKSLEKYPELKNEIKRKSKERYSKKMEKPMEKEIYKEIIKFNMTNPNLKIEKDNNKIINDTENYSKLSKYIKNKINQKQSEIKNILNDIEKEYGKINEQYFKLKNKINDLETENPNELLRIFNNFVRIQTKVDRKIDNDFKNK